MALDTLQLSKDLQEVEFTRDQADALAQIFLEYTNQELEGKLKEDLRSLEQRLTDLVQSSLRDLREAIRRDIDDVRSQLMAEIKAGDASTKVDLTRWIVGSLVLNLAGTAGLIITLVKIIPH